MPKAPINVKKTSPTVLLIIDMINDFDFDGGERMFEHALEAARVIARLKAAIAKRELATIYVNDNYGKWREDFEQQLRRVEGTSEEGRKMVELLRPKPEDHYVLKPQRSGFFETPLAMLLEAFDAETLVMTGVATDICVLFTAHDAHMRGFKVAVPSDCTAAIEPEYRDDALKLLERVADADTRPAAELIADIREGIL